jgi:hypothetical protein
MLDDEPEQGALFEIKGPDKDARVWLVSGKGSDAVVVNLGPREAVASVGLLKCGSLPISAST